MYFGKSSVWISHEMSNLCVQESKIALGSAEWNQLRTKEIGITDTQTWSDYNRKQQEQNNRFDSYRPKSMFFVTVYDKVLHLQQIVKGAC